MQNNKLLWLALAKNLLFAVVLTTALMLAMWLCSIEINFDKVLTLSIIATISGVAYLITIRNPQNYFGFYLGILSSACLGVQFALLGNYDLTFLYFAVFIPFQYAAIVNWRKKSLQKADNDVFMPKFLPLKKQIFFFAILLIIIAIDYIFAEKVLKNDNFLLKIVFATMISSSILANYLMIGKWLDTWLYWLLYSVAAIFSAVIIQNNFNLLLFVFFLIINAITFISWLKSAEARR